MKIFVKTFGCQMNVADSDEMTRHIFRRGFVRTHDEASADAILINTCTVRELAEHKAVSYVGRLKPWKEADGDKLLVVAGCAAERAKETWRRRFPFIDLVVGAKDIDAFPSHLDALLSRRGIDEEDLALTDGAAALPLGQSRAVQYVTIMRGCNYSCSYCIVPSVRGRERYIDAGAILADVAARVADGAKEVCLLGQTVNSYRPANPPRDGYDFADLLRDVAAVPGVERVRFMSPHPFFVTPKLAAAMAEMPAVCRHLHLPVQSGSTPLLRRMRRTYTREAYLAAVRMLRDEMPDLSITTDFIVGFPGETEDDFAETLSLVDACDFDSAYCFKYSPRPGTEAAALPDDVLEAVKDDRVNSLLAHVEARGRDNAARLVGTDQEVLLEETVADGSLRGRTRGAWRVRLLDNGDAAVGDTVQVQILETHARELKGRIKI